MPNTSLPPRPAAGGPVVFFVSDPCEIGGLRAGDRIAVDRDTGAARLIRDLTVPSALLVALLDVGGLDPALDVSVPEARAALAARCCVEGPPRSALPRARRRVSPRPTLRLVQGGLTSPCPRGEG